MSTYDKYAIVMVAKDPDSKHLMLGRIAWCEERGEAIGVPDTANIRWTTTPPGTWDWHHNDKMTKTAELMDVGWVGLYLNQSEEVQVQQVLQDLYTSGACGWVSGTNEMPAGVTAQKIAYIDRALEWKVPVSSVDFLDKKKPLDHKPGSDGLLLINRPDGALVADRWMPHAGKPMTLYLQEMVADGAVVLLEGPPGVGKSTLVRTAFWNKFFRITGDADTTTDDFNGTYVEDPTTPLGARFVLGPLPESLQTPGSVLFVDEVGEIPPKRLVVLNDPLERSPHIIKSQPNLDPIYPADGWGVIFATNNRESLPKSVLSRVHDTIDLRSNWESTEKVLGGDPMAIKFARAMNEKWEQGLVSDAPQTREVLIFTEGMRRNGKEHAVRNLIGWFHKHDREVAARLARTVFDLPDIDPDKDPHLVIR